MPTVERRTCPGEVRVMDVNGKSVIRGYGIVFNSLSEDLGGFRECVRPGAITKVLSDKPDIRGLYNHDPSMVLGRTAAGTMRIGTDEKGVYYEIDAPTCRADVVECIKRGDVSGSSFSFVLSEHGDHWRDDANDTGVLRELLNIASIFDMGPVTFPAYSGTTASARSADTADARDGLAQWREARVRATQGARTEIAIHEALTD